jgi:hypothetical protein
LIATGRLTSLSPILEGICHRRPSPSNAGIESAKADVVWIDAIIGKCSKIGVRRVVAISRSGFTKNAIKKAKDANIDTLSLGQALEADWETAVKNVIAAMLRSHLPTISKPSWSVIILGDTQREETP